MLGLAMIWYDITDSVCATVIALNGREEISSKINVKRFAVKTTLQLQHQRPLPRAARLFFLPVVVDH